MCSGQAVDKDDRQKEKHKRSSKKRENVRHSTLAISESPANTTPHTPIARILCRTHLANPRLSNYRPHETSKRRPLRSPVRHRRIPQAKGRGIQVVRERGTSSPTTYTITSTDIECPLANLRQQIGRRASREGHANPTRRDQDDWREDGAEGGRGFGKSGHGCAA